MSFIVNSMNDLDQNFIKCVSSLNNSDHLKMSDAHNLQMFLQDAIKAKTGATKDFTAIVKSCIKPRDEQFESVLYDESKGSNSDNELELDLLKDDLMCVICQKMDVGARNRLIECSDCHALYHQECHKPAVVLQDSFETWLCRKCTIQHS